MALRPALPNHSSEILSGNRYTLKKITYDHLKKDGTRVKQSREAYDRGNGAAILLYDTEHKTVILTRQFRLPTFINGNGTGMLIEACMSPGSVTEILYFFIAEYAAAMKVHTGGIQHEQENIGVPELPFEQALTMTATGKIRDGKTIMLLQYVKLHSFL